MSAENIENEMQEVIDRLETNYSEVRAGRANPAILNKVNVDYYGTPTPINQIASIAVPEARQIVVSPWDKSILNKVYQAIEAANVGINPMNDGTVIRLIFPELTEERRNELSKDIKKMSEEAKIAVRAIRGDEMKDAKNQLKDKAISEDEEKALEDKIQKATDKFIDIIDQITDKKVKEIMTV